MLAEKELALRIKEELLKKKPNTLEERLMVAEMFKAEGHPVRLVLMKYTGVASSTYYGRKTRRNTNGKRGCRASEHTMTYSGQWVWNEQVVEDIKWILDQEFVDYGYRKVTRWLQQASHYMINQKKVYRLMKKHQLVNKNKRQTRPKDREWVKDLLPPWRISLEYLEIDIKYGYAHGQRRNGLTVTVIDVESRWVLIKNHCCQLVNVQTWTNIKFS